MKVSTRYEHEGWTIGGCPFCEELLLLRVLRIYEDFRVGLVFSGRPVDMGILLQCDFCERLLNPQTEVQFATFEQWDHTKPITDLVRSLGPNFETPSMRVGAIAKRSLLKSLADTFSLLKLDLGAFKPKWLYRGGLMGFAAACLTGSSLIFANQQHQTLAFCVTVAIGVVLGGLVDGVVSYRAATRGAALHRLYNARETYQVGIDELIELSLNEFPKLQHELHVAKNELESWPSTASSAD